MAYVVERPPARGRYRQSRYEIRESELTDRGPRARSLASFRVLDDAVLAKARARALRPFDAVAVRRSARRVGAPVDAADVAERSARTLLADLGGGTTLAPALAALLREVLPGSDRPDQGIEAMLPWMRATPTERGVALQDLMELGDRFPVRARPPLSFPRIHSSP